MNNKLLTVSSSLLIAAFMATGCSNEPMQYPNTPLATAPTTTPSGHLPIPAYSPVSFPTTVAPAPTYVPPTTVATTPTYTAPVTTTTTTTTPTTSTTGGYVVQKGDTVFSIMRSTGVHWKKIIELNSLQAPDYIISPGQTLKIN